VGIFVLNYPLWSSPSLLNAAHLLAEAGYAVDIFTDSVQPPRYVHAGALPIEVHVPPERWNAAAAERIDAVAPGALPAGTPPRRGAGLASLAEAWDLVARRLPRGPLLPCIRLARSVTATRGPYLCLIGAEIHGLIAATAVASLRRLPAVYWSLELWPWRESPRVAGRARKLVEHLCHRRAAFTVIQDEERAGFMAADGPLPLAPEFVFVPATARGVPAPGRNDALRERLGIPRDSKVLLYAGSWQPWACLEELAESAQSWPPDWVLLLHGFGPSDYVDALRARCRVPGRVRFSYEVLPYHELDDLVRAGDIGLALYRGPGPNWSLMGAASGKLSHYLKCGLPAITSDTPSLRRLVEGSGSGACVAAPGAVAEAAARIFADLPAYRTRALRCYEDELEFGRFFPSLLHRLEGLRRAG
jgi:glycosyltransferase involved in cell wall biosynthesis